jgi:hypothetical protein
MKKLSILTITMIALSGFVATTVRAQSPHFIKGPTASLDASTGEYCVTFKESGLGSAPVTYTFAAGAGTTFTYQCFTKSGNNPQGSPNSVSGSTDKTQTTITPHNGTISATICLIPEQDGASCNGNGLVLRLVGTCYQNVTFSDGTNTVPIDDASSGTGCP